MSARERLRESPQVARQITSLGCMLHSCPPNEFKFPAAMLFPGTPSMPRSPNLLTNLAHRSAAGLGAI